MELKDIILEAVKKANCPLIRDIKVVDTYTDESSKSITVRLIFSHSERTLTKEEVLLVVNSIVDDLAKDNITLKYDFVM